MNNKRNGSTTRWRKIRVAILRRDNNTCYYCGIPTATTVDHLTPVEQGGNNTITNLVAACSYCNNSKGNRTEEEYLKFRNKKYIKQMNANKANDNDFLEGLGHPLTKSSKLSPKSLKSPFEQPNKGV
jgi:5-methylcytosine-specific restriction endonuclease McrA